MLKCPMCRELLPDDMRKCRKCQTDLSLLSDYVSHLREGLAQAENQTRAGELGEAVWAYLAVLEIDPDNATARRQVGKVVTAVRQFDSTAPGRRWLSDIHRERWWTRWFSSGNSGGNGEEGGEGFGLLGYGAIALVGLVMLWMSYSWGFQAGRSHQQAQHASIGSPTFVPMLTVEEQEKKEAEERARKEAEEKKR